MMSSDPADLSHHFSTTAKRHVASEIKKFYKFFGIPGIRNLAGGKQAICTVGLIPRINGAMTKFS